MDTNHRRVLRANHQLIVNNLELSNTHVLDKLQEDGTISSGESEEILTNKTKRDQNAKLLYILKRRSCNNKDPYLSFLNALSDEYDFICDKLKREEAAIPRGPVELYSSDGLICFHCQLVKNLRARDLTHQLFEDDVISDDDLDTINSDNTSREDGVIKLLEILKRSKLPQRNVIKFLVSSLKKKYNYIVSSHQVNQENLYSCQCRQNSKASCVKSSGIDYPSQDENQNDKILDDISIHPRLTINKINYETDEEDITHCQSLQYYNPTSKCRKTQSKRSDEIKSMALGKNVPKAFPNNKKTIRLCSKLWNNLFTLREKGNWKLFNSVTLAARHKYKNNPDIQVILYRSDMCKSAFYNDSQEEALDNFNKASDLIHSTSMPDWHLARLLPLKVELLTRLKEFDNASSLLKEAHQAMSNLVPCLSTGAVYFFEASYLSAVLQCSQGGTRSSAIRQRVKSCYLTAIRHYEQEKYFEIKSFLNQVYLFLALFALGVDVKQIEYLNTNKISREDIALAERCLNLYENNCWNESTNWSRMLFFISRAEQHKQRQSLHRSLDYLNDAWTCAVNGGYDKQRSFIEHNIGLVEEAIQENIRIQEITQHEKSVNEILANLEESSSDSC